MLNRGVQSVGEGYKAERWLLHSLQVHLLSAQLRPLLKHQEHTRKYYNGKAACECVCPGQNKTTVVKFVELMKELGLAR